MFKTFQELFPLIYRDIAEIKSIIAAQEPQFVTLDAETTTVLNNNFIKLANETGINYYERILKIMPDKSKEDLEFRRSRVENRWDLTPVFTQRWLEKKLDEMIGVGKWTLTVDYNAYQMIIETSAINENIYYEIVKMLEKTKPCNLGLVNVPKITFFFTIAEEISFLDDDRWNYVLGSWKLGEKPFFSKALTWNYELGNWKLGEKPFASAYYLILKPFTKPSVQDLSLNILANSSMAIIDHQEVDGVPYALFNEQVTANKHDFKSDIISPKTFTSTQYKSPDDRLMIDASIYYNALTSAAIKSELNFIENVGSDTGSSTVDYKNGLANGFLAQIAKVRINNEIIITDFKLKAAASDNVYLDYFVSDITLDKIELLDANDNVLTSSSGINHIIISGTMRHIFKIREG